MLKRKETVEEIKKRLQKIPYYVEGEPPNCLPWQTEVNYWDPEWLEVVWGEKWGGQGIGKLKRALVCYADESEAYPEFAVDPIFFGRLHGQPDITKCREEQEVAFKALKDEGIRLDYVEHPTLEKTPWPGKLGPFGVPIKMLTSTATAFVVNGGAIIPRRGVTFKIGAEVVMAKKLMEIGCPILYTVTGKAVCELGASAWLDFENWVIGVGAADNSMDSINQIRPVLEACGVEEILTSSCGGGGWGHTWGPSPSWGHITGFFNTVDLGLAIAYVNGLDYSFIGKLIQKGVNLIEVPEDEKRSGCINITLIEPGKVIMPVQKAKPPKETLRLLHKEGVDVIEIEWTNMSILGGGLHCGIGHLVREMPGPSLKELDGRKGKIIGTREIRKPDISGIV